MASPADHPRAIDPRPQVLDGGSAWDSGAACGLLVPAVPMTQMAAGFDPAVWPLTLGASLAAAYGVVLPTLEGLRRWRVGRVGRLETRWIVLAGVVAGVVAGRTSAVVFGGPPIEPVVGVITLVAATAGGLLGRGLRRVVAGAWPLRRAIVVAVGSPTLCAAAVAVAVVLGRPDL